MKRRNIYIGNSCKQHFQGKRGEAIFWFILEVFVYFWQGILVETLKKTTYRIESTFSIDFESLKKVFHVQRMIREKSTQFFL